MAGIEPAQAIRNAVEAERAAARFYRLLSESTDDSDSRDFLQEMARQEKEHASAIEETGRKLISGELPQHAVGEVELVETLPSWRFVEDVSLEQALEIAITAEQQAALYYDAFADCFEGELREFFQRLAKTEEEHEKQLRRRRSGKAG